MDQNAVLMIVLLMFVGGMLYLSSRTRKKQMAAQQAKLSAIVPGVRVTTIAGLQGTVTAVADDTMELEIAPGVRTTWLRAAVRDVVVAPETVADLALEADDASGAADSSSPYRPDLDKSKKDLS